MAACSRPQPPGGEREAPAAPASASASVTVAASASASVPVSAPAAASASARALVGGEPLRAKSIGHTSYVLKLTFPSGGKAVFKPRSRLPLGDRRYKGEIAAYRLATALGIDNVPPAAPRSFDASSLRDADGFADKVLVDADGRVRGALMPWIDAYRVLPLESDAWRSKWEKWLTDARSPIPDDQRALAAAVSNLIAFDYITANWDRWSGANIAQDGATGRVLFVDNDGAFYESPPKPALARQLALLRHVVRFSRRFAAALRALDEDKLRDALGEESAGAPLLPERVVAAVDERRRTVLEVIDARVTDAGADETFAFE